MTRMAQEIEAYGAYLNASYSPFDDADEQRCFDEDLLKARAAMEVAWLEQKAAIIKP